MPITAPKAMIELTNTIIYLILSMLIPAYINSIQSRTIRSYNKPIKLEPILLYQKVWLLAQPNKSISLHFIISSS
jgi:hypothetical protein